MAHRWLAPLLVLFAIAVLATVQYAQTPASTPTPGGKASDLELVQKLLTARKEYQKALEQLYVHYHSVSDKERERWAKEELVNYHRIPKNAFIIDLHVPPANLKDLKHVNVPEANKLFTWAMQYKDKGYGMDYTDNQRRAELLFQEILSKYPSSDKISDVAFELGDIYESKAYRMYYLAVEYYQRSFQWNPKPSEARLRAARIYDRHLNNRTKALELYREVKEHDVDPRRHQEADRRIAELSATK
jgi:tetratricopeptide (TPR) repeat protein